jgi:transcription initiation factor TFIID subunit 4
VVRNASGGVTVAATSVVKNVTQTNQIKPVAQIKQTQQFLQKVDTSSNNTIINSNSTIAATSSSVVSINQNSNSNNNLNNNQKIATASTATATTLLTTNNVVVVNNHSNSNSSNVPNEPKLHTTLNNKTIKSQSAAKKHALANAEKKSVSAAATAATSFYQPSSVYGDDDINDVAAMGGVNLAEETQKILGSTEFVGVQIRSCKDEVCLNLPVLQNRIRAMVAKHGLEEPSSDVAALISHACQERLKNILEKLAIIAEHRIDVIKVSIIFY